MAIAQAWVMIPIISNKGTEVEIDMQPLVLCKDCRYWNRFEEEPEKGACGCYHGIHNGDWFCAEGEERS